MDWERKGLELNPSLAEPRQAKLGKEWERGKE